jgi:hypothetical protein
MPKGTEWLIKYKMANGSLFEATRGTEQQAKVLAKQLRDTGHIDIEIIPLIEIEEEAKRA